MGRHSKPSSHRFAAFVGTTVASVPLMQGTAVADGIDWGPIIRCESGGHPQVRNPNSTASGLFQFLDSTWTKLGGRAFGRHAADASPQEQEMIANRAYAQRGLSDWQASSSCWRGQLGRHTQWRSQRRAHRTPIEYTPVETSAASYRVRAGDTLSRIAAEHDRSWQQLFAENRAVIRDPNRIYVGSVLQLSESTGLHHRTTVRHRTMQPSSLTGQQSIRVQTTGYSYGDNQGGSNATISSPVLHSKAAGDGTYDNPTTLAVPGHGGKGMQTPAGTRVYFQRYHFYGIVEDSGATPKQDRRFDIWTDGRGNSNASDCMDALTGTSTAILNPPPGLPVDHAGPRSDANGCHAGETLS